MAGTDTVCDPDAPAQLASPAASAAWWPEHSILELGALPSAVPCVRLHTTLVLREWHLTGLADAAELVAAELATNAVQASREPQARPAAQEPASPWCGCTWPPTTGRYWSRSATAIRARPPRPRRIQNATAGAAFYWSRR